MNIRMYLLSLWGLFDPIYFAFTRLTYVETNSYGEKTIFRVRLIKYKGKKLILSDGSKICKNDMLIKIHLHNIRLLKELSCLKNNTSRGISIYRHVLNSMPFLSSYIKKHPFENDIKGIIGITMINKGVQKLGFECFEPNQSLYKWFKFICQLPIFLLSQSHFSLKNMHKNTPVFLCMSKEQLFRKYGK
ncbi:YkoP family protein [Bacillus aquiflavi]|uniref:YkoP family protein n=1 Tax=Bacillus aquiflavi TaxID=2672567 RepID=UPI002867D64F|nr:hypothetical protein [Bacillus aquiflavi]